MALHLYNPNACCVFIKDTNWILQRSTGLIFYRGTQATLLSSLTADLLVHKLDLKKKFIYIYFKDEF